MLVARISQKPLPFGGLAGDGVHIWDADLKFIDEILADDGFVDILLEALRAKSPGAAKTGRRRLAVNQLLRVGVLKHVKNWSWRTLFKELQRNLDYRAFTQVFDQKTRSAGSLSRNLAAIDADVVRALNEHLCQLAVEKKVIKGRKYRQDTTVTETNIHHPTDSSLLVDGVRVLQRVMGRARELVPSLEPERDRSKAVQHRALEIAQAARAKGESGPRRREQSYRGLLRIVRPVVTAARRVASKLGDRRVTRHSDNSVDVDVTKAELEMFIPRVEQVIKQTRARICRGDTNYPGKLLSLFELQTTVIRKGKAHKPTEFGNLVDLVEVENGFVSDYRVLDGNPDDGSLLIPALERHIERFGKAPYLAATDRGFWSAKNEKDAYALGVKKVSIPVRGKLSKARRRLQRLPWFRKAQGWRANGEGRIGTLKNVYGMNRCMYKGEQAMERWVGWCVFANNLIVVARALEQQRNRDDDGKAETTKGQSSRAAA